MATSASPMPCKTLLIVYHSMTGGTLQMATAAADGAHGESGVQVKLVRAFQCGPGDVIAADGFIFATPENLGAMSGGLKDFFDRCYYPALDRLAVAPMQSLVCAGSDGQNAARQIERIATGWRLKPIAEALIVCTHAQTPQDILREKKLAGRISSLAAHWVRPWPQGWRSVCSELQPTRHEGSLVNWCAEHIMSNAHENGAAQWKGPETG